MIDPSDFLDWMKIFKVRTGADPTAPVTSVFGRSGVVVAQNGDYTWTQIGSKPTDLTGYGIVFTGDVSNSGNAVTINANVVSYAKFQQMPTGTILGNPTAAQANVQPITIGAGLSLSIAGVLSATGSTAPVQSVFGRTGVVIAQTNDYTWAQIGSKPTTIAGYGITDGITAATAASTYQALSQKDQVNGYPGIDSTGKINPLFLPAIAITETFVVASQAAMLALTAQTGDVAIRTDLSQTFILQGTNPAVLGDWVVLQTPASPVQSVFGRTGVVTAQFGDYSWAQISSTPTTLTGYGISFTGDVLNTGNALAIANGVVTYAKMQTMPAFTLHGNPTSGVATSQAITLGAGLSFSGTTLVGNVGTVTNMSIVTANGFQGSVATSTSTPAVTLQTSVTGVVKGQTNSLVAATDADITSFKLTGYVAGAGTVAATDSILQAFQKIVGNMSVVPALSGDIVTNGTTNVTTISNNAVSYAKMQQVAARSLIGNFTGSTANATAVLTNNFIQTINVQRFTASGTYTPTTGMKYCVVEGVAGGGGGSGCSSVAAGQSVAGGGGGSGGYVRAVLTAAQIGASQTVTIGAGGTSGTNVAGGNGGASSLGSLISIPAGGGGNGAAANSTFTRGPGGSGATLPTSANATDICLNGSNGDDGIGYGSNNVGIGGNGARSPFTGALAIGGYNSNAATGSGYGNGGAGAGVGSSGAGQGTGSAGMPGLFIITEYIAL